RDADAVDEIADEARTADHSARGDRGAGIGEGVLEYPDGEESDTAGPVRGRCPLQKEVLGSDPRRSRTEHEGKPPGIEQEPAEAGVDDAPHQNVHGLSRATKSGLEHGEARLHAED